MSKFENWILAASPLKFLLFTAAVIISASLLGGFLTAWGTGDLASTGWWSLFYLLIMVIVATVVGTV